MLVTYVAAQATKQILDTLEKIDNQKINELINEIDHSKRLFFTGSGRSLLIMRCIAMRMMHLGYESYIVGDTTTPAFTSGDLLIAGSGSGETSGTVNICGKAKSLGGRIAVFCTSKFSTLSQFSDICIEIPMPSSKSAKDCSQGTILPGGSIFEQCLLILGDSIVLPLLSRKEIQIDSMFSRHANLE